MVRRFKEKRALLLIILSVVLVPVFLVACGGNGDSINRPAATVAEFSGTPVTGTAPLTVAFTDNSTGDPDTWSWDFGDGSALDNTQNPSHTYNDNGVYTVTLTVDGPNGTDSETKTDYITVTSAVPVTVAEFSADNTTGPAPLTVMFTDLSTGDPDTWSWDFGDNTTSALQDPSHTYNDNGVYTVSLTADGPGGSDTITKTNYIAVGTVFDLQLAEFSADNTTGPAPLTVAFTDNSTGGGPVNTWSWDFGDGSALDNTQNPSHTYSAVGTYDVTLTVTGPGGSDTFTEPDYVTVTTPTDNFNRADADPIGAPWVTSTGQGDVAIEDNVLRGDPALAGGAYYNASFDNNQYSQATIAAMSNVGVTVRMDNTVRSYYRFQIVSATSALLDKYVAGAYTELAAIGGTFGVDNVIRLEVDGETLTAKVNGSTVATLDDPDLTGGFPGVRFFGTSGRLDDWEGGSLP
jgi:PKD repeat protein